MLVDTKALYFNAFKSGIVYRCPPMYSIKVPYDIGLAVVALDLSKVGERGKLKVRLGNEPHWQRLRKGCFLGFRPSRRNDGKGTWVARVYDPEEGDYTVKSLGGFAQLAGNEMFAAAKNAAEAMADLLEAGGELRAQMERVADACREYAKARPEAEARFRRLVYEDPIAKVRLDKLRRKHLREWRQRLEAAPALVSRSKRGELVQRPRAPSTINRDMVPLRAALNAVLAHGAPNTEAAWQEALNPIQNADQPRKLYLDKDQRRQLLEHVSAEAHSFIHALCLLPLRVGAMAALASGDYDRRTAELTINKDKTGNSRRILLPSEAAKVFSTQTADKLPAAPIFTRGNGRRWERKEWGDEIRRAAEAAGLPKGTIAYTLRHSTITDLVTAGLPLLTIAQISGTSVQMIEKHYGHLVSNAAVKALAELAL